MAGNLDRQTHIHKSMRCLTASAQKTNNRQMCLMDKYGFPRTKAKGQSTVYGFKTGDNVKAVVPNGKYRGKHIGKVMVRTSGYFDIKTIKGKFSLNYSYCKTTHKKESFTYQHGTKTILKIISNRRDCIKDIFNTVKSQFNILSNKALDNQSMLYSVEHYI